MKQMSDVFPLQANISHGSCICGGFMVVVRVSPVSTGPASRWFSLHAHPLDVSIDAFAVDASFKLLIGRVRTCGPMMVPRAPPTSLGHHSCEGIFKICFNERSNIGEFDDMICTNEVPGLDGLPFSVCRSAHVTGTHI